MMKISNKNRPGGLYGKASALDHFSPEYNDHIKPELNP